MDLLLTPVGAWGAFAVLCVAAMVLLRRGWHRAVAAMVLVVAGVAGALVWNVTVELSTWDEAVLVDESTLELRYTASSCEKGRWVRVDEQAETIRLTLRTREASSCDDMGNAGSVRVDLDQPPGDRRLVDAACEPEPIHGGCTESAAARKATPSRPAG